MSNETYKLIISGTIKEDKRLHIEIGQPSEGVKIMDIEQIRAFLCAGLSMVIRSSKNEGQAMRETIKHLESEFVDTDSFKDIKRSKVDEN